MQRKEIGCPPQVLEGECAEWVRKRRYMMHTLYTLFYLVQCAYDQELSHVDFLANEGDRHEDLLVWEMQSRKWSFCSWLIR
ncbi:hypothetical protein H5410_055491 [Solanum commersonii]|uniref:Uncharacterized protein n=1 Tax=Solanum commersonii TaxID=4109 RepID=A0A9J5WIW1_SOLCO|nr:hypothetical protein H5410_055491 [Solanum commersonii]